MHSAGVSPPTAASTRSRRSRACWTSAILCALCGSITVSAVAGEGNWPNWRGPRGDGVADPGAYPTHWDAEKNVLWKAELSGKGCSTPAVWDRRIFLTAPVDGKDALLAFDWDGKPLWRAVFGPERPGKHRAGSGSNPSPVTDGTHVFAYFKSGTLAAVDREGRVRWRTNLQERFGSDILIWDVGTSPVLTAADVVVAVLNGEDSYVAAFDKASGKLHWKADRRFKAAFEADQGYSTPIVLRYLDREAVLVWGAEHVTIHDAADGRVRWTCGGFNPEAKSNWPPVATPVIAGDVLVVPYGRGMRLHGVRLAGEGDVTAKNRLWLRDDTGSYVPTPVAHGGAVYLLRDRAGVECIEPTTGRTRWTGDLPKSGATFYASPVLAGGNLYAARDDGVIFVCRLEGGFQLLAENRMGEPVIATPVPVAGRLLLRGERHLFCIGTRGAP